MLFHNIVGDLEFKTVKTDQLRYFDCKVVLDNNQALLKRRRDINVDVFSDKNVDDEDITPLTTENVLVKSLPINQSSTWETPSIFEDIFAVSAAVFSTNTQHFIFNPAISLTKFDIDDSLVPIFNVRKVKTRGTSNIIKENDFILVEAQNNLRDVRIDITNLNYKIESELLRGRGRTDYNLELRYGKDWETATNIQFFNGRLINGEYTNNDNHSHEIGNLNRADKVWLYFYCEVSGVGNFSTGDIRADVTIDSMDVAIKGTSIAYNTIVPSIRLYDGISQTINSISGLTTSFPLAEPNGELYNQRIFNGNYLKYLAITKHKAMAVYFLEFIRISTRIKK